MTQAETDRATPEAPRVAVALALATLYLVWGSTYFAIKIVLRGLPPLGAAAARFFVAGLLLYGFARLRGSPRPSLANWRAGAITGCLLLVVGNGAVTLAERSVSSSVAAVVIACTPLFTLAFARLFGDRVRPREAIGVLVGLVGVIVLETGSELGAAGTDAWLLLAAPIGWSFGSMWGRRLPLASGHLAVATQMISAGILLAVLAALRGERFSGPLRADAALALLYLMLFGSIAGLSAYQYLLRTTRAALATSYAYVNPVIAVALGVGIGGEPFAPRTALGSAIVLVGVLITIFGRRP